MSGDPAQDPRLVNQSVDTSVIVERLDHIDNRLGELTAQVKETNGRVEGLELWRARIEGMGVAMHWLPTIAIGVATGGLITLITHLTS